MKIIDRYVLFTFLKNYLISFMVLVGMYVVLDMVFNFDDLTNIRGKGMQGTTEVGLFTTIANIADYYLYQSFLFFVHLSGIIPVLAAAFTLMRLSRFNELTAILASGVPLLRVAMPIILAGVVLNALMIVDQEIVIPRLTDKLTRDHNEIASDGGKWFQIIGMQSGDRALLYAARYYPPFGERPATMEQVDVVEREEQERVTTDESGREVRRRVFQPRAHVSADRAVWNAQTSEWDLFTQDRATEQWVRQGRRVVGLGIDAPRTDVQTVASYPSTITPQEISLYKSSDWVELLSTRSIDELLARPGSYGQTDLLRMKHLRFTQPIMNVILLLLAIPCVLTRTPGYLKAAVTRCLVLTGLSMGTVFLAQQLATQPLLAGSLGAHWPAFMAWLPIFIWGPIAVFLLDRVKT